jgi:hypothetical protein
MLCKCYSVRAEELTLLRIRPDVLHSNISTEETRIVTEQIIKQKTVIS